MSSSILAPCTLRVNGPPSMNSGPALPWASPTQYAGRGSHGTILTINDRIEVLSTKLKLRLLAENRDIQGS